MSDEGRSRRPEEAVAPPHGHGHVDHVRHGHVEAIIRSFSRGVLTVTVLGTHKRPLSFDSCAPALRKRAKGDVNREEIVVERARSLPRDAGASKLSPHALIAKNFRRSGSAGMEQLPPPSPGPVA